MKLDAPLARKTTAGPSSWGSPARRWGVSSIQYRWNCGSSIGDMSVLMYPGAMAFTRTFAGAHSAARLRVRWCTAALDALYAGCHCGRLTIDADIEPTFTIEPPPCSIMCRPKTWLVTQTASRLTSITARQSASVTSTAGLWMHAPALLISTSARPKAATVRASIRSTSSRRVTSASTVVAPTPSEAISASTSAAATASRPTTTMFAPASARARAKARPRPRVAPVTTAVLPVRLKLSRTDIPRPFGVLPDGRRPLVEVVRVGPHAQPAVQGRDGLHLRGAELQPGGGQVLHLPRCRDRLRDHDVSDRQVPRERDLRRRRPVPARDANHGGVREQVNPTLPERRPGLGEDAEFLVGLPERALLQEGVQLDLVDHRHDARLVDDPSQVVRLEVRHTDRGHPALVP